jgi:hypothetical protein
MREKYLTEVLVRYLAVVFVCVCIVAVAGYVWYGGQPKQPRENIVEGAGTVVWLNLEGGFWGIVGDDGNHYDPINLGSEFQGEGLRIYFRAKVRPDLLSSHMWGEMIEILDIQKLQ